MMLATETFIAFKVYLKHHNPFKFLFLVDRLLCISADKFQESKIIYPPVFKHINHTNLNGHIAN